MAESHASAIGLKACIVNRHDIPEDWRISVENMYAKHSIAYDNLKSYAYGFAVWNERNVRLSWDETKEWLLLLGIEPCPVLYDGIYDEKLIRGLYDEKRDWNTREGYVIWLADSFSYAEYRHCVAKLSAKVTCRQLNIGCTDRQSFQIN